MGRGSGGAESVAEGNCFAGRPGGFPGSPQANRCDAAAGTARAYSFTAVAFPLPGDSPPDRT